MATCNLCASVIERGDLRCAVCGSMVPDDSGGHAHVVAQIMRCDECGAAVSYDAAAQAPRCAFCDSVMHVESIEDPLEQTELFAPFKVGPDAAAATVKTWLGSLGFFRPSDLASTSRIESIRPLYWVGWVFTANAEISWTADSDAGSGRSAWAPHSGVTPMTFDHLLVSASRGLSDGECKVLSPSYLLDSAAPQPYGPPELVIEQFDVQRSEARAKVVAAIESTARDRLQAGVIPGSRFRHVHIATLLRGLSTRRFAFPAWVMAYHYGGRPYRAVVSGQDATVITGTAPLSWYKILGVTLAIAGLIALILTLLMR